MILTDTIPGFYHQILASRGSYHTLDYFLETQVNHNSRLLQTSTGWALRPSILISY